MKVLGVCLFSKNTKCTLYLCFLESFLPDYIFCFDLMTWCVILNGVYTVQIPLFFFLCIYAEKANNLALILFAAVVCDPVMGDQGKLYVPQELVSVHREKVSLGPLDLHFMAHYHRFLVFYLFVLCPVVYSEIMARSHV